MRKIELGSQTIAFYEYGDPSGDPLFFFHGWPGSGRQASMFDAAARQHGYRVIAPDRPGIGGSSFSPARGVCDWPQLTAELANALSFDRFAVVGVSGGGPYAIACAAMLPARITVAAIVCGAPPIADLKRLDGLSPAYRFLLWLNEKKPHVVRRFLALARPFLLWSHAHAFWPPARALLRRPDRETLEDPTAFDSVFLCNRDAFFDLDGLFHDATLYAQPWQIPLEAIRAPLHVWHGAQDSNFHWSLAEELAARLPTATLQIVENEAHFSLPIRQAEPILAALRQAAQAPARATS